MRSSFGRLLIGAVALMGAVACSTSNGGDDLYGGSGGAGAGSSGGGNGGAAGAFIPAGGSGGDGGGGYSDADCAASAKLIYLVSVQEALYSFDPTIEGTSAYRKVGNLRCSSSSTPQSMSVDRSGKAYVFYSDGQMFNVDTTTAACTSTPYRHPAAGYEFQLGMGFTATMPNSTEQTLFILSPDFGLATVDTNTFAVNRFNRFADSAGELTGGLDAKLFVFEADNAQLSEITNSDNGPVKHYMHAFSDLQGTMAWAFARYAGKFYMFTATGGDSPTRTTIYDPVENTTVTRDRSIGFTVVGAGQSTCVPPPPTR